MKLIPIPQRILFRVPGGHRLRRSHGASAIALAALLALASLSSAAGAVAATNAASARPLATTSHTQPATAAAVEDIRDIRPPYHLTPGWLWLAWTAAGLGVLAIGYGLWRWRHQLPGLRPKQPFELALERLEAAREWLHPTTAREFSIAVSVVVRAYIEGQFATYAAHRTTDEFLHDCAARPDSPLAEHRTTLEDFLRHCDLAKFARWILSVDEMEAMLQSASAFVRATGVADPTPQFPAHSNRACSTSHRGGAERANAPEPASGPLRGSIVTTT